ncbi:MAG: hypothetical protein BGN88_07075 [Clostridiales bacterium 43-6]|nr:MAG: hypothetical protein BGN88_07075 [Clostridiales bacterium 43-6]
MFYKLALGNVKRSVKDYTIYFLTLTFGICIFYVFNSIESQQAMLVISKAQQDLLKALTIIMGYVSVFISFILGFLIIYANNFLVRRRKKELGIYLTLGMEKGTVSRLLIVETLCIGLIALFTGLLAGVTISQGLSVVTAKMFAVNMKSFRFIFSPDAFYKSILYFGIIFFVVIIFNFIVISRYKLIDLINADKKSEKLKVRRLWLSVLIFIVSLLLIAAAYYLILEHGMTSFGLSFKLSLVFGSVGTFLFFFSLSGFLLRIVKANKKLYLKNLNMFVLRQINSKINTAFISMTFICLMLLIAIGTLASGYGMSSVMTKELNKSTPYDATFYKRIIKNDNTNISDQLKKDGIDIDKLATRYTEVRIYDTGMLYKDLLGESSNYIKNKNTKLFLSEEKVTAMTVSDFNRLAEMQNKQPIALSETEYAISNDFWETKTAYRNLMKDKVIQLETGSYTPGYQDVFDFSVRTYLSSFEYGMLIVPDHAVDKMRLGSVELSLNFKEGVTDENLRNLVDSKYIKGGRPYSYMQTRTQLYEQGAGLRTIISYLAIYIGIVFLITSAAVLALQQLSESSDNSNRYRLLRKIGSEEALINRSVFMQIAIYFLMPLSLAIIHSIVGLKVVNDAITMFGNMNVLSNTLFSAVFIVLIYGGYFLAAYFGSLGMLKLSKKTGN